eukprot:11493019-Heterocapsa_arctica.AAC.2
MPGGAGEAKRNHGSDDCSGSAGCGSAVDRQAEIGGVRDELQVHLAQHVAEVVKPPGWPPSAGMHAVELQQEPPQDAAAIPGRVLERHIIAELAPGSPHGGVPALPCADEFCKAASRGLLIGILLAVFAPSGGRTSARGSRTPDRCAEQGPHAPLALLPPVQRLACIFTSLQRYGGPQLPPELEQWMLGHQLIERRRIELTIHGQAAETNRQTPSLHPGPPAPGEIWLHIQRTAVHVIEPAVVRHMPSAVLPYEVEDPVPCHILADVQSFCRIGGGGNAHSPDTRVPVKYRKKLAKAQ